ncbi:hypothetical protein AURDEDRAFT_112903 [Auricularia subglabra TFB-10046 SS5]|nr:hypothetical protein AURDEDRAFT_112903 [Auricularia subglabra TFB-10046 SS5]
MSRLLLLGLVALARAVVLQEQRPFVLPLADNAASLYNPDRYAPIADYADEDVECDAVRVPVVLGVMSRCPDALYCEAVIDNVLQQVGDIVDIGLTFIGTPNATDSDWGITCKHGGGECAANALELCAIEYSPVSQTDRPVWWDYLLCLNEEGRYRVGEPALARACAVRVGIDYGLLETCVSSGEGRRLLHESVAITRGLGIVNSCTVVVNGRKVCVRDDNKWRDCEGGAEVEDFVKQIEDAFDELNGADDELQRNDA